MGATCSNSGKLIRNKDFINSGSNCQGSQCKVGENYGNLYEAKTATNSSNSRKSSFD